MNRLYLCLHHNLQITPKGHLNVFRSCFSVSSFLLFHSPLTLQRLSLYRLSLCWPLWADPPLSVLMDINNHKIVPMQWSMSTVQTAKTPPAVRPPHSHYIPPEYSPNHRLPKSGNFKIFPMKRHKVNCKSMAYHFHVGDQLRHHFLVYYMRMDKVESFSRHHIQLQP